MARYMVLCAALLLVAGSVVKAQDPPSSNTTTTTTSTTTTTTTTTPTTTSTEETTTTEPPTTTPETSTTTTTPETTTTTTTPETTTTSTTTETPTTTEVTTSTSTSPPTTTAPPTPDIKYSVTDENNVTCIIVAGEIFFNVNYTLNDTKTAVKSVFVPSSGVTVDGSCNTTEGDQFISFSWDEKNNNVQMNFATGDKDAWMFTTLTASLLMDNDSFANATDAGKTLELTVDYNFSPGEVSVNHSFICRSSLTTNNVTATLGKDTYGSPVTSTLKNIQMQAFNKIKNQDNFADSVHCTADNTSDVVPIAVGCALAGLVVIVLIAYLVGRRKRSGAYQSV